MLNTRIEEAHLSNGVVIPKRIIIELPITFDMLSDCYSYYAMDAKSEIKKMLLEVCAETINRVILEHEKSILNNGK